MRVVLLQNVPRLGKKSDVKFVSDGYAGNYLFPRKLAIPATPSALVRVESEKRRKEEEIKLQSLLLEKNVSAISGKEVVLKKKAAPEGHLFAGIHKEEISHAIKEGLGLDISPEFLDLERPIKETGSSKIYASVGGKRSAFTLTVEGQ